MTASLVVLAAACGGDADSASPITVDPAADTTPTTTDRVTTTTEDPRDAIERAYFAQWDAFVEILSDPDPANPLIDRHFAGAAKEKLLDTIAEDLRAGVVTRLPDDPTLFVPRLESLEIASPTLATVIECTTDGLVVVKRGSGEVVNDRVGVLRATNTFELIKHKWKVTNTRVVERLTGDERCDE